MHLMLDKTWKLTVAGALLGAIAVSPLQGIAETAQQAGDKLTKEPFKVLVNKADQSVTLQGMLSKTEEMPIDLQTVLKLVADQNLYIQENETDTRILQSRVRLAQVALLPNIQEIYNQNRFQGGVQIFGGQTLTIFRTTVQPQLAATWTIYPGGRNIYDILAAKRRKSASVFQVRETTQQQMARASEEFYRFLEAIVLREIAQKSVQEAQKQVEISRAKMEAGVGTKLDMMRNETLLTQHQRLLIASENDIRQAEQNLLHRLNVDINFSLIPTNIGAVRRFLVPQSATVQDLVSRALTNNPSLQKVSEELKALGIDYKAIRSDFFPAVTLSTYINGTGARWSDLALSRFGGLAVNMNLLEGMGLKIPYRLQEKKGEIARKILERQILVRDIEAAVMKSFLDSQTFSSEIVASEKEFEAAQEAYRLALGRYQAGVGLNLDVIDSEVDLTRARANVARSVLNFNRAQIQLLEALGEITPETLVNGVPSP